MKGDVAASALRLRLAKKRKLIKKESRFRRIENARAIAGRGEERPAGEGERGEQKQTSEFQREGRVIN